jgi:hypothetical protein
MKPKSAGVRPQFPEAKDDDVIGGQSPRRQEITFWAFMSTIPGLSKQARMLAPPAWDIWPAAGWTVNPCGDCNHVLPSACRTGEQDGDREFCRFVRNLRV